MPFTENLFSSDQIYRLIGKVEQGKSTRDLSRELKIIFGKDRVNRVMEQLKINASSLKKCSKKDLRRLFSMLALVELSDLQCLYEEICCLEEEKPSTIRGLDAQKSKRVVDELTTGGRLPQFEQLTKSQIDILMNILVPFEQLDDIFLNKPPAISIAAPDSGHSEEGKIELSYILNLLRFKQPLDSKERQIYYAKRIGDREPNKNLIIPHEKGYYFVNDIISEGSVYATLLQPITNIIDNFIPMILFRGTRIFPSATRPLPTLQAGLNDNQANYTFPEFSRKLAEKTINSPEFFIQPNDKFAVCGMSLGGGHAALTAADFPSQVTLIELTAPIGLLNPYLRKYATYINSHFDAQNYTIPKIIRIIDEEDAVTHLGQGHLGHECLDHIDYELHCSVSEESVNKYQDEESEFWSDHFNNRHHNIPNFILNTRLGGFISLIRSLCGKHAYNHYEHNATPRFFSLSNKKEQKNSLDNEHLIHQESPRQYVELGRRAGVQLISGGCSALFASMTTANVITLATLSLVGTVACLTSPVGMGLIISAGVFLSIAITTAVIAIATAPNIPEPPLNINDPQPAL